MAKHSCSCVLLSAIFLAGSHVLSAEWGYSGEELWEDVFPTCGEDRQSPVNIREGDVKYDSSLTSFTYNNYDTAQGVKMTLRNNGHTVVVALSGTTPLTVEGGGLPGQTYRAFQLHFHWGESHEEGSEHLVSGRPYPMELHVVHYNTKYASPGQAISQPDGLAVLGFLYQVSPLDNPQYSEMVRNLQLVVKPGSQVAITPIPLRSLLPYQFSKFFRYAGSLTTPPCHESVVWTVFHETIRISQAQMDSFKLLLDSQFVPLMNNFRQVQPLNDRKITANFQTDIDWSYHHGPVSAEQWSQFFKQCQGPQQSPIDIQTAESQVEPLLTDIKFHYYHRLIRTTLVNNGHSADLRILNGDGHISGGGLQDKYQASQVHFHWGSQDLHGSEHRLDGQPYPMELHIVHYKKSLGSVRQALTQPDGLAVLGFFFQVSPQDNPALDVLINGLRAVRHPGARVNLPTLSLDSILPADRTRYFRYNGSLTVPGCYQSVVWSVFTSTIPISSAQLAAFRLMKYPAPDQGVLVPMVDNYRPVQNLGARNITRNFI